MPAKRHSAEYVGLTCGLLCNLEGHRDTTSIADRRSTPPNTTLSRRVAFSDGYCRGPAIVKTPCNQTVSGTIVDDAAEDGPRVHVMFDPGSFTYREARELAAAVFDAAAQAEVAVCPGMAPGRQGRAAMDPNAALDYAR